MRRALSRLTMAGSRNTLGGAWRSSRRASPLVLADATNGFDTGRLRRALPRRPEEGRTRLRSIAYFGAASEGMPELQERGRP